MKVIVDNDVNNNPNYLINLKNVITAITMSPFLHLLKYILPLN